ncbi:hypothetical protein [Burkholderia cenocepacia]|uniref:hypothetical protein n=1 Tax=Burkholderia cenocepacia TaxID=95486 RepID=UPI001BA84AED|nr:hypothetical protein [Burkholderia cenocepacia]QUN58885.1 hypothetical protein KEH58_24295 [Burkholderia cenocepacia]
MPTKSRVICTLLTSVCLFYAFPSFADETMPPVGAHAQLDEVLPPLVGSYVYNDARTNLYKPEVTDSEMADRFNRVLKREIFPLLSKLKVTGYRYIDAPPAVVVNVTSAQGDEYMVYGSTSYAPPKLSNEEALQFYAGLLRRIPSSLSKRDIQLVKNGSVKVGMSETALYMTLGYPDHTNRASYGDQLVYAGAYVYIRNGRVTAWQEKP